MLARKDEGTGNMEVQKGERRGKHGREAQSETRARNGSRKSRNGFSYNRKRRLYTLETGEILSV